MPVSISLSTTLIPVAGTTSVTANVWPQHPVARVTVDATCTSQLATVSVSPASKVTDAQGNAVFTASASGLVNINPVLTTKPTASCNFLVWNTSTSAPLAITTANACNFTDLLPRPAACGNPAN
jgi:hypothetical protein